MTTDTTTTGTTTTGTTDDGHRHGQAGCAAPPPHRLCHQDQAADAGVYEDILGFPLLATWAEANEPFGAERVYCHTFFGLADGARLRSSSSRTRRTRISSIPISPRPRSGTSP